MSPEPEPDGEAAPDADADPGDPDPEASAGADPGPDREAVVGAPPSIVEADAEAGLTPMLAQYLALCRDHDDALLLFQVGDFYEAFCEAAVETARVCETTLTERTDSTGAYPMAGIPIDNATTYLDRLLDAGYRVALAEQVEPAAEASGLVDRAVTRVVTPGTLTDDDLLAPGSNYVACLVAGAAPGAPDDDADGADGADGAGDDYAVAALDASTGDCRVTSGDRARAIEELERLAPAELLVDPGLSVADDLATLSADPMVSRHDPAAFGREAAADRLVRYDAASLSDATAAERRAVGALLAYGEYTQGDDGPLSYVSRIVRDDPREALRLDAAAVRSLELFESRGDRSGTALTDVVDRTVTAPGRRRLAAWLRRPLVDRAAIEARHGAVAALRDAALVRADLRATLGDVYDVERLVSRVSRGRANARDLRSLLGSLDRVPELRESLADLLADRDATDDRDATLLADVRDRLDELADVRDLLREAIAPDPPQELTEGGVIREGFSAELDDLRATEREGREWVADLEERERERTGIDSLSVGHTQVHGYYIEVTNPNLDRVPDDYTRRQTLKNAERFYTPELKRREDEIVGAAERADAMEYDLFREVRADVAEETERIQRVADALADVDAVTSFATVAAEHDYCRPAMRDGRGIDVEAGRHPVVERTVEFVANDVHLGPGELALVTGPNMAGKSTYMRQAALICVLAQAGSFVPADDARLPVVDRVFTRVGASDDIAGGQSTFMREMTELTEILREATPDSLVLLDEVGRGTATTDGRAIARAAAEFVHDEVRAHTLFATHYHELTSLADGRERLRNLHFGAERVDRGDDGDDGAVTFLHRVVDGPASSSYGIEVARMAGVPAAVVDRARELVAGRDDDGGVRTPTLAAYADGEASDDGAATPTRDGAATGAAAATNGERGRDRDRADGAADADRDADDDLAAAIRDVDVAGTTPLEALNLLADLRRRVDDGRD